jgi:hypothetical protein
MMCSIDGLVDMIITERSMRNGFHFAVGCGYLFAGHWTNRAKYLIESYKYRL